MRRSLFLAGFLTLSFATAAQTGEHPLLERFAMRAPQPIRPVEHSAARAGYPLSVSRCAVPSVTRNDYGGYIGGGSLKNNNMFARGPGSATGPLDCGTYGTDFGGFRAHLGRVFLAPSDDPSRGYPISWNYRAEGPRLTDIGTLRPFRKAVLEKREDIEEHGGGHGPRHGHGHGEAGHTEGGH